MRNRILVRWRELRTRTVERWLLFANISFYMNVVMAAGKLLVGLYTMSVFLCVNALYNAGMALTKIVAVRGYKAGKQPPDKSHPHGYGRKEYNCYFAVGLILAITSVIYIIYSLRLFLEGDSTYYDTIPAITIATITFTEIGLAVYGVTATRKYKEPAVSAIKMTNLASALISLVLTQMALLSFTHDGEVSFYNGLIGVVMGGISALMGLGMMLHISRVISGRYYDTVKKKLSKAVRKSGVGIRVEPVRFEDHGPRQKRLYVRVRGEDTGQDFHTIKSRIEKKTNVILEEQ